MWTKNFVIAIITLFEAGLVFARQPTPMKVEEELLQGTSENGLKVYRGIAFAAPPIGDL